MLVGSVPLAPWSSPSDVCPSLETLTERSASVRSHRNKIPPEYMNPCSSKLSDTADSEFGEELVILSTGIASTPVDIHTPLIDLDSNPIVQLNTGIKEENNTVLTESFLLEPDKSPQAAYHPVSIPAQVPSQGGWNDCFEVTCMGEVVVNLSQKGLDDHSLLSWCKWARGTLPKFGPAMSLTIDFSDNSIGDSGACALIELFTSVVGHPRVLKLYKNYLSLKFASSLAQLIESQGSRTSNKTAVIEELHLSHNQMGEEGVVSILRSVANAGEGHSVPTYPFQVSKVSTASPRPMWIRLERNGQPDMPQDSFVEKMNRSLAPLREKNGWRTSVPLFCTGGHEAGCSLSHCSKQYGSEAPIAHIMCHGGIAKRHSSNVRQYPATHGRAPSRTQIHGRNCETFWSHSARQRSFSSHQRHVNRAQQYNPACTAPMNSGCNSSVQSRARTPRPGTSPTPQPPPPPPPPPPVPQSRAYAAPIGPSGANLRTALEKVAASHLLTGGQTMCRSYSAVELGMERAMTVAPLPKVPLASFNHEVPVREPGSSVQNIVLSGVSLLSGWWRKMPITGSGLCWEGPRKAVAYYRKLGFSVHLVVAEKHAQQGIPTELEMAAVVAPEIGEKHMASNGLMLLLAKRLGCQFVDNAPFFLYTHLGKDLSHWFEMEGKRLQVRFRFGDNGAYMPSLHSKAEGPFMHKS